MEQSNTSWYSNSVMESGNIIDQWGLDSLEHLTWEDIQDYSSHPSLLAAASSNTTTGGGGGGGPPVDPYCSSAPPAERPRKLTLLEKASTHEDVKPIMAPSAASSATILSFGDPDSPSDRSQLYETVKAGGRKRSYGAILAHDQAKRASVVAAATRPPSHNRDHVIAERKRRENLTRKFIALSAIVPGLKKMDKASVLGDAVKYMKQLQERVKSLEDDQAARRAADTAVVVKKTQILSADDCNSSCDENFEVDHVGESLPEIEVRVSEKSVLIKIHSDNRRGLLVRAISEVEKLNLTVISTSVVPFAASSLDITVMAQMEEGFSTTVKDIVKNLNSSLRELI